MMTFFFTTTCPREALILPRDMGNVTFSHKQITITTNIDGKTLYNVTEHYKRKTNE